MSFESAVLVFAPDQQKITKNTKPAPVLLLITVYATNLWSYLLVGTTHLSLPSKPVHHGVPFLFDMQSFFSSVNKED